MCKETRTGIDDTGIHCPFSVATAIRMVVAVSRMRKIGKAIIVQTCQNYL